MKITAFNTAVKGFIAQAKGDCQKVEITRKSFFLILSLLKAAFPLAQFGALLMVKTQATPNSKCTYLGYLNRTTKLLLTPPPKEGKCRHCPLVCFMGYGVNVKKLLCPLMKNFCNKLECLQLLFAALL